MTKKKSFGKIASISIGSILLVAVGFHFFLRSQKNTKDFIISKEYVLVIKNNKPTELENQHPEFYRWLNQQKISEYKQQISSYFSKALSFKDYSVEDLLGNKDVYYCLDQNNESCIIIPLSNEDNFFTEPILSFLDSSPIGISKNENIYSIEGEQPLNFSILDNAIIISPSFKCLKSAIKSQEDESGLSLKNTDSDELYINPNLIAQTLKAPNAFTENNIFSGKLDLPLFFSKSSENNEFESQKLKSSLLSILDNQKLVKTEINSQTSEHNVYIQISNGLQFFEDQSEYWKINAEGYKDLQIDFSEKYDIDITSWFKKIKGVTTLSDFNPNRNSYYRSISIPLEQKININKSRLDYTITRSKDTLWYTPNFALNKILFGDLFGQKTLRYFILKDDSIILFESPQTVNFYSKATHTKIELNTIYTETIFPSKSKRLFNSTIKTSTTLSTIFPHIKECKVKYHNSKLSLSLEYFKNAESRKQKFKTIHVFESPTASVAMIKLKYKAKPFVLFSEFDSLKIYNNDFTKIKQFPFQSGIKSLNQRNSSFTVTSKNDVLIMDYNFNIINHISTPDSLIAANNFGLITKKATNYFYYNSKGKLKKDAEYKTELKPIINSNGLLLFKQENNNISIINEKGKISTDYPLNDSTKIVDLFFQSNILYSIDALGRIIQVEKDEIKAQLLGTHHFISNPFEIIELTPFSINIHNNEFEVSTSIKNLNGVNSKVYKTENYYVIQNLEKEKAIVINSYGKIILSEFPLTPKGEVIAIKNKIYRLDNFGNSFQLDYVRI